LAGSPRDQTIRLVLAQIGDIVAADDEALREEFLPPTALESAVRALGADTVRYRVDYIMLPMRDGVRLATVVFRPRAAGRYPTLMIRTPYQLTSFSEQRRPMHAAQFKNGYVLIVQNERGSEWSEGEGPRDPRAFFTRAASRRCRWRPGSACTRSGGSTFPVAERNWHTGERNDLASDGPVAHVTLHHGAGHESALHFRASTGEVATGTPMAALRQEG
jgi:X-Pro dipeptidyl-peptidase (S15 family)